MRLSQLNALCRGLDDPFITVESDVGLPADVRSVDTGVAVVAGDIPVQYVCLLTEADEDGSGV